MPFCTNCGHQNPEGSNFCARCGEPVAKSTPAPPAPEAAAEVKPSATSQPTPTQVDDPDDSAEAADRVDDHDTQVHTFEAIAKPAVDDANGLSSEEAAAVKSLPGGSALLILNHGTDRGERFLIDDDSTSAGRHPKSDIFLDDITVSRHHAKFERADGAVSVTDLGSLNGTYVNRKTIESSTTLANGDEVMIGKFRLVYFASEHGIG